MNDAALATIPDPVFELQKMNAHVIVVQEVMKQVMKKGEHYGVIPGTMKPTLFKAGAEKLCMTFHLAPMYEGEREPIPMGGEHREYVIKCTLKDNEGVVLGQGLGSCSTMEGKYRYRSESRKCPECGAEAIIKGKAEYGGGWLCFAKKGGCGAKWEDGDQAIESLSSGKVENENPADLYNTILKMAKKRAFVDAVLTVTAASDIFTQDVDDMRANFKASMEGAAPEPKPENDIPMGDVPDADQEEVKMIEKGQIANLHITFKDHDFSEEERKEYLKNRCGVDSTTELTQAQFKQIKEEASSKEGLSKLPF